MTPLCQRIFPMGLEPLHPTPESSLFPPWVALEGTAWRGRADVLVFSLRCGMSLWEQ